MSRNINLLSKDRVQNVHKQRYLRVLKQLSVFCLVITAGTSLLFFILTLSPILSNVKQQENTMLQNLSFSQNKIARYLFVKDRVTAAEHIIQTRYSVDNVVLAIQQQVPPEAQIESMEIGNKVVDLKVTASRLDALNAIIAGVTASISAQKMFKDITLQSITADSVTQMYTLTLHSDLL